MSQPKHRSLNQANDNENNNDNNNGSFTSLDENNFESDEDGEENNYEWVRQTDGGDNDDGDGTETFNNYAKISKIKQKNTNDVNGNNMNQNEIKTEQPILSDLNSTTDIRIATIESLTNRDENSSSTLKKSNHDNYKNIKSYSVK